MLRLMRLVLLLANCVTIPAAFLFGWALAFGVDPVRFTWLTQAATSEATANSGGSVEFQVACAPRILDQALYSRQALAKFAAEAVVDLNTYDYLNWDAVLPPATERYMTAPAGRLFMATFRQGKVLQGVRRDYLSVIARIAGQPIVTEENETENGRYWTVQVPVEIFYGTGAKTTDGFTTSRRMTQMVVFNVRLVEQIPTQRNFRGIGVSQMTAFPVPTRTILDQLREGKT